VLRCLFDKFSAMDDDHGLGSLLIARRDSIDELGKDYLQIVSFRHDC
jgi:hypothetical protein